MGTPHNQAKQGEIAKIVLMPGDPLRAQFIAHTYLEEPKQFNAVRNMFGYTGTYKGKQISIMGSGMGMPSIGIYSHELFHVYDVDNIIRVGSAGAISPELKLRDVVFGQGSCTDSNYAHQFGLGGTFAPIADFTLLETAVTVARVRVPPSSTWSPTCSTTKRATPWTGARWACWPWRWRAPPCTATPPRRASGPWPSAPSPTAWSPARSCPPPTARPPSPR